MKFLARFGVGLVSCLALNAQKVPDAFIGSAGHGGISDPELAATQDHVFCVWQKHELADPYRNVFFSRSSDRGGSWLASPIQLSDAAANTELPQIAVSGETVHVVWNETLGGHGIRYIRSLDAGASWLGSAVRVDAGPTGALQPREARLASSDDNVYVVWRDFRSAGGLPVASDIFFARSTDGGATFSVTDTRLNSGGAGVAVRRNPRLAASGSNVFVVWEDHRNGDADIYFNRSTDFGQTWLAQDVRLNTFAGPGPAEKPQIAVSGSHVYVSWQDRRNNTCCGEDVYFNRSTDNGATWLASDIRLDTDAPGAAQSARTRIAAEGSSVYVTWRDRRNGTFDQEDIYFNRSLDNGATWLDADVRINTAPAGSWASSRPEIAAVGSAVCVTWYERPGLPAEARANYSLDRGDTWLATDVTLNQGDLSSGNSWPWPQVVAAGSSFVAAWVEYRSGWGVRANIPFGAQPYGVGLAGLGGIVPRVDVDGFTAVGQPTSVELRDGVGGAGAAVLVGFGGRAEIPLLGGTLLVDGPIVPLGVVLSASAGVPGAGAASIGLPIPGNSALIGEQVTLQSFVIDAGAPAGLAMTAALEMWIG